MKENENYNKIFPTRLRELMKERHENQQALANVLGKQRQTISLYVTGSSNPDYETLKQIAEHYQVTSDWLIGMPSISKHGHFRTHEIKISDEFANAVASGDKTFEVRENDRGYQKGDLVKFTVIDNIKVPYVSHELHNMLFEITYVLSGWGIEQGKVAFAIKKVER